MNEERDKRKLSAVLSADVKGYSRLMGEDESGTVRTLKQYREIIAKLIQRYGGRVVDSPGDNLLAEFASVVDAVDGAVEIQKELKLKNDELPENRRMNFRIGVNLGDVVEDGENIYGDGVNIAARVESLADGGGICISGTAYDQIGKKLPFGYEYLGEQTVKNIEKPVRIYRVLMEPEAAGKIIGEKRFLGRISRRAAITAIIILAIAAGGLIGWNLYLQQSKKVEPASLDKMLYPLPDNPSIAVLPFDNMSADPEQEYFSDGITEEIITALAKVPDIFVIARNSTFVYKGKPVNIKQVSEELGVRYVLEGGVRKAGDRIRITAQLIDAIKGHHLWAERYDGTMGDVFDLQDKITQKIIAALAVILTQDQGEIISDWGTKNTEAYDAYLQAGAHFSPQTRDNVAKAIDYLNKAVELDPNFGPAHVRLARAYNAIISRGYDKELGISNARSLYQKHLKLALQNPTAGAHMVAVWGYLFSGKIEEAMSHAELAISMKPNSAQACETLGGALIYEGRPEEAIKYISKAMRINPEYPAMTLWWLGVAQFCDRQLEDAATTLGRARKRNLHLAPWFQIAAYEHVGRGKENPEIIAEYIKARGWKGLPSNLIEKVMQWYQFKDPDARKLLISGLQKAGLK